jgi:hypothetical protein
MTMTELAYPSETERQTRESAEQAPNEWAPGKIADGLDEDLQRSLAALFGAPRDVAELTLTTYRFGTRMLLSGIGLIQGDPDSEESQLKITELGSDVIAACAKRHPHLDEDVEGAVERLRARLRHPAEAEKLKLAKH